MTHRVLVPLILALSPGVLAQAQDVEQPDPIASALHESSPEERRFHEHVTFLAHPALEGRLPGSTGSTLAESMIISTFEQLGLQPGFRTEDGSATHRQPFTFQQGGRFSDRSETRIVEGNNIGAVLPGTGSLSDRWIIIGAHHDHIGRGDFGSRRGRGEIHEGADDNASGTASLLLAAELLARSLPDREDGQADRRSLLFVTFSGEESGLNGSAHCAENLPMPFESVDLMINIDMIGRISEEAVSISGVDSGEGLATLLDGLVTTQGLDIRRPRGLSSRSDHAEFYRRGMPVLFMTESIFPDEYHTPDDESWLINNRDGAKASRLLASIIDAAATHPDSFPHREIEGFESGDDGPSLSDIKIRFGIKPGNYGDIEPGIAVAGVSPDTSAEDAGLMAGDMLVFWNRKPIEGVREWMLMMAEHEPGDIVTVGIIRDGEALDLPVMLKPRN